MSGDRAMEIASLLLREGVLRRDDHEHLLVTEELSKDPVLRQSVSDRLAAVGYLLTDDLGYVGVRIAPEAESAWPTRNRAGLTAAHIRLIVYLWTQLVYRQVVGLRRDLQPAPPAQGDLFDAKDDELFVSYRAVWSAFADRMSANHLKGVLRALKRQRFIRYDEKRDRIWPDGSLYVLVDRVRMEEFVVELARRLGAPEPAAAVEQVVTGTTVPREEGEPE